MISLFLLLVRRGRDQARPYGCGLLGTYRDHELMSPANNHAPTERNQGWFYKLALLDFVLIFEVKMQESEGV